MIAYSTTRAVVGDDEDSTCSNYNGNDKSSVTAVYIASAFYECEKIFDDIKEFIRRARTEEAWRYENKRAMFAPAIKPKPVMVRPVIRPIFNRRMMFPVSGHLPWRALKKLKDR